MLDMKWPLRDHAVHLHSPQLSSKQIFPTAFHQALSAGYYLPFSSPLNSPGSHTHYHTQLA